jgi:hypothetical protein
MAKIFWALVFLFSPLAADTVYCIHGFMRAPSCMNKMARQFEEEGYASVKWGYPSKEKYIQEHAADLVKSLQETAAKKPGEPIHFVTHSLGGLIVRSAHNHPDCPEEAKQGRAVLLVPPNQGTQFGQFLGKSKPMRKMLGDRAGKQLMFCDHFDFLGEFARGKQVLIISGTYGWNPVVEGKNDGKVGVKESCLNTPHQHVTHFSGHSWIMYSDGVIDTAKRFVALGEL